MKRDDQSGSSLAILHHARMPGQKKMRASWEGYRYRTVSISMLTCSCDLAQCTQAKSISVCTRSYQSADLSSEAILLGVVFGNMVHLRDDEQLLEPTWDGGERVTILA